MIRPAIVAALTGLLLALSPTAGASVLLSYQFITPELPAGTRCLLVASTADDDFGHPGDLAGVQLTAGAVIGQDNVILAVLTAESLPGGVTGCAGALTIEYAGGLGEGDRLRLYWLPGLDPAATVIPLGTSFADYRAESAVDGSSIGYALPADGTTASLYSIATANGGVTVFPGSVPASIATYPPGQNSDGDPFTDLQEFAMGLDIYEDSFADQPTTAFINGGTALQFEFPRRADLSLHPITLGAETSLSLADGSWSPVAIQPSPVTGRWEAVRPVDSESRRFFRLKVETP